MAKRDLVGKSFGKLTVIQEAERAKGGKDQWLCRCECGKEKVVRGDGLLSGASKTCGCSRQSLPHKNLTGKSFGRWTVLSEVGHREGKRGIWWLCRCSCGTEKEVDGHGLRKGSSLSCGCFHKEQAARHAVAMGAKNRTHGETGTPEYVAWAGIVQRCTNPNSPAWEDYGGRGIALWESWRNSYEEFLSYVGRRPTKKHQIDRYPDMNGNYEPGNVRWATHKEQQRNRRSNVLITHNGKTQCVSAWAEEYGKTTALLWQRLFGRHPWPMEVALRAEPTPREFRSQLCLDEDDDDDCSEA